MIVKRAFQERSFNERERSVLGGRDTAYTIYSTVGITAAVYFPVIRHYIRYGNSVLASVYTIYGNLLYRVSHVLFSWKASKTSKL